MASVQKIKLSSSRDIPFNKLVLSQANVRRVKAGISIEQLTESIAQRTLLQSLSVRAVVDADGQETGMFEVPAGGRRYRALELLVKQKRMAKTQPVPCLIIWEAEVAEVPEFTDSEIHIVAGLLLPIWKRLPNELTRVYRLQTDAGERIIGRKVSPAWVACALDAGTSSLSPDAAFTAMIDGKTILDLADGLQLRRVRVMGANRIELTGFSEPMRDRLRAYGLFGEIISWKLRFFVPIDATGPAILAKVLECFPIARIADRAAA